MSLRAADGDPLELQAVMRRLSRELARPAQQLGEVAPRYACGVKEIDAALGDLVQAATRNRMTIEDAARVRDVLRSIGAAVAHAEDAGFSVLPLQGIPSAFDHALGSAGDRIAHLRRSAAMVLESLETARQWSARVAGLLNRASAQRLAALEMQAATSLRHEVTRLAGTARDLTNEKRMTTTAAE